MSVDSADSALTRLYHPDQRPFERLRYVGLAICCRPKTTKAAEIRHVGVLYRENKSTIRLLHLPEHGRLGNDEPSPHKYSWLEPPIPPAKARLLAQQCVLIAERYLEEGLPVGLRYTGARFDGGKLVVKGERGLRCATFVLAVFLGTGVRLLRTQEWVLRIDDIEPQYEALSQIRASGDVASIKAVEDEFAQGPPRYRPEEVAAAGTAKTTDALPLSFRDAARSGERIANELLTRAVQQPIGKS